MFCHYAVDPQRLAIGGFSDGASYSLSLAAANGDLFTHCLAFSPGFMRAPVRVGRPAMFVTHGTRDCVLPIERCSRRLVAALREAEYPLSYLEFEGPHEVPLRLAHQALAWFAAGSSGSK